MKGKNIDYRKCKLCGEEMHKFRFLTHWNKHRIQARKEQQKLK